MAATEVAALEAVRQWAVVAIDLARDLCAGAGAGARQKSGPFDLVTPADVVIEGRLAGLISERFPEHSIVGEEGTREHPESRWRWSILDRLRARAPMTEWSH